MCKKINRYIKRLLKSQLLNARENNPYVKILVSVTAVIELNMHDALDHVFCLVAVLGTEALNELGPRLASYLFSLLTACKATKNSYEYETVEKW